ncbi:hypothetical protein CFOL_v3_06714 [Cephalotus follicularis]|uniref:Transmembrane protein n=1 Tax=Cephalotus follicularis TaxID=3775 RepID=A0A1Q3B5P6_CEPFO|nr:hypothetical protein CFOL_v3_06714 [Cephalotus follicularis]
MKEKAWEKDGEGLKREGGLGCDCELSITSWYDGIVITVFFFFLSYASLVSYSSSSFFFFSSMPLLLLLFKLVTSAFVPSIFSLVHPTCLLTYLLLTPSESDTMII